MGKKELILAAITQGNEVWNEISKDWYAHKLPGSKYNPTLFLVQLLIGHLDMKAGDVYEALKMAEEVSIDELKKDRVLSGSFRVTEDVAKLVLAMILEVPEIAAAEYTEPEVIVDEPVAQQSRTYEPYVRPERENVFEAAVASAASAAESVKVPEVTQCPHCKHDFERCENGFYDKPEQAAEQFVPYVQHVEASDAVGCVHVDQQNQCVDCSDEPKHDCTECSETIFLSKAVKCKDFEDCDNAYCPECAKESILPNGYCHDCGTIKCDSCDDEIDNGAQKKCSNSDCQTNNDYCETCALRLLNKKGECSTCSEEQEVDCSSCDLSFTDSLLEKCKNFDSCGHSYCADDVKDNLNEFGFCDECENVECSGANCGADIKNGSQKKCSNQDCNEDWEFCEHCASRYLNASGECSSCSGETEYTCDGDCGEEYTESQMKKCKNFDDCDKIFCREDAKEGLDRRGYCENCASERELSRGTRRM